MQQLGTMTMDPLLIEKIKNDFYINIFYFIFIFKNFIFFFFFFFCICINLKYQIKLSIKNNICYGATSLKTSNVIPIRVTQIPNHLGLPIIIWDLGFGILTFGISTFGF